VSPIAKRAVINIRVDEVFCIEIGLIFHFMPSTDQFISYDLSLLQKSQMGTLPNPSHQGRGLFINPLPWWERARVRG